MKNKDNFRIWDGVVLFVLILILFSTFLSIVEAKDTYSFMVSFSVILIVLYGTIKYIQKLQNFLKSKNKNSENS